VKEGLTNPFSTVAHVHSLLDGNDKEATFDGRLWEIVRSGPIPRNQVAGGISEGPNVQLVQAGKDAKFLLQIHGQFHNKDKQQLGYITLKYRQLVFPEAVSPAANK